MWDDEVLFHIHQIVGADVPELRELLARFVKECANVVSLLALFQRPPDQAQYP
jgi:hypothetical protein